MALNAITLSLLLASLKRVIINLLLSHAQEHFKKEKEAEHQRKKEQRKAELAQK